MNLHLMNILENRSRKPNMLQDYLLELSEAFVKEAIGSPSLIEDMAAMEKYLSESYAERAFIELLQNADDARSQQFKVIWNDANCDLIVANDGNSFDKSDLLAISRSGASSKERTEKIGYRGVGFKSATCFSDFIVISSSDCLFTFSKQLAAKRIGLPAEKVPTVRIPLIISKEALHPSTIRNIEELHHLGFNTIFVFCRANREDCINELHGLTMESLLFLNNVRKIEVDSMLLGMNMLIQRREYDELVESEICDLAKGYSRKWLVKSLGRIEIATPWIEHDQASEDFFHCFLPTLDTTGLGFRINGDFTTDPSRKHLIIDERTKSELRKVGEYIAQLISENYGEESRFVKRIISGFANQKSTNRFSATLDIIIKENLQQRPWINTIINVKQRPKDCFLLPEWYEKRFDRILCENLLHKDAETLVGIADNNLRKVLIKAGVNNAKPDIFSRLIANESVVRELPEETTTAMMVAIIKDFRIKSIPDAERVANGWFIKNENEIFAFDQIKKSESLSINLYQKMSKYSKADTDWFFEAVHIIVTSITDSRTLDTTVVPLKSIANSVVTRWRAAEEVCCDLEERFGNIVIDVSKQNLGYDILSQTSSGEKRYIEVKSVNRIGDMVTMTNNEYTTAIQYGKQYYLCIVAQQRGPITVVYVQDPLKNARLEKRVRMWEWTLENYNGERFTM